jgi:hypothetical protein
MRLNKHSKLKIFVQKYESLFRAKNLRQLNQLKSNENKTFQNQNIFT